jgi:hypothetical protein
MSKAVQNMYGQRHNSLLQMWKNAREIRRDLQGFARRVGRVMNFGLESSPKSGEVGVCQTILMSGKFDMKEREREVSRRLIVANDGG